MKKILFFIILGVIGLVLISGYVLKQEYNNFSNQSEKLPEIQAEIFIENISTDKTTYYSSELVNLDIAIYSNSGTKDTIVKVEGINGRFNKERILDLEKGINEISFSYELPRCNVCGGIKAGDYILNCEVIYENINVEDSTTISIQQ